MTPGSSSFVRLIKRTTLASGLLVTTASLADSQLNLSLVGPSAPVAVNQIFDVKLRATQQVLGGTATTGRSFVAIDCILQWAPSQLQLVGLTTTGSVPLLSSYFPTPANDYTGINESTPPADGTALYYALAPLGNPVQVSTTGVQVVTFRFKALTTFSSASINILPTLTVTNPADTIVYDGTVPGLDVTGTLTPATIVQVPACPGDLNGSGTVDSSDLALMLNAWGQPGSTDLNGSGVTDAGDLAIILGAWGSCPGS